jgi:hypothetical protein
MANPTLINGFEDVLTFISQQAERIKRLEEENDKLKKENKEYEFESCESLVTSQKVYGKAFAIQAERDKLKKENEQLKETAHTNFHQFDRLMDENKKLIEENEKLTEQVKKAVELYNQVTVMANDDNDDLQKRIDGLTEENKKLKEEKKTLALLVKSADDFREECIKGWRSQVEKLKEENEKLKKKYELSLEQTEKLEEENKNLDKYLAETKIHLCFEEDMEKLKEHLLCVKNRKDEEIQQYKDTLEEHFVHYDNLKEENKKQQERAEKFRVRLCDRNQELVKALSPWKKNHEDHKRILEAIVELKEELQQEKDGRCADLDESEAEIKKLQEEYEEYALTHCCEMNCEKCGLTTTEDDLGISLKYGSLICEDCHEQEKDRDAYRDKLKEENEKLKEDNERLAKEWAGVSR